MAIQEIEAFERNELPERPYAGSRIGYVPILRSRMKKRKAAECVMSAKLFDPKKHTLDRGKVADDMVNPLSQVCQAIGIDPAPVAMACKRQCRAEDTGLRVLGKGGALSVPFEKCIMKEIPLRKSTQATLCVDEGGKRLQMSKTAKIMMSKKLHDKRRRKHRDACAAAAAAAAASTSSSSSAAAALKQQPRKRKQLSVSDMFKPVRKR